MEPNNIEKKAVGFMLPHENIVGQGIRLRGDDDDDEQPRYILKGDDDDDEQPR